MSCKEGSTHHHACDCREAYVQRLEEVAAAARWLLDRTDWTSVLPAEIDQLKAAVSNLKESKK